MSGAKKSKSEGRVLLPPGIEPLRYDITLTPDLETFTFEGLVTIRVKTSTDLPKNDEKDEGKGIISMHAKELSFQSASFCVVGGESESVDAEEIRMNLKATTVAFVFPSPLPTDKELDVTIVFSGLLNNQMAGFSRSQYIDIHGNKKYMASTQFESLDARRAFPCWDEPARKAVFGVTLVIPSHLMAFSNMPEKKVASLLGGTQKSIHFLDSPLMSSYLVAFCVGEFDAVQKSTSHGVMVKLYTPPGKSTQGNYALDCATRILDLYDDFFGVPYPLPKLDMVALPEFAAGAMENWGLVTYREVDLLVDDVKSSAAQKQRVCIIVAHELAHQWFGNLVTMTWWDDLWLNEGFATWAENYSTDGLFPEWRMFDQFVTDHLFAALKLDALRSSHPIQVPIAHAEEVEEVFDAISYCKGGSVVKMIYAVIGKTHFQKGLSTYMKRHKYGNTETYDLWKAWEEASDLPIQEMMSSWTEQMGFPLLSVTKESWEDDKVTLDVKQSWFLSDGSDIPPEEAKTWCIPVTTCTAAGKQKDVTFMREATATLVVPLEGSGGSDAWVKLNAGQDVPMRVCLSDTMIERLASGIKSRTLPVSDRAGLLSDAYALVKAGHMKPEMLLKLLSYYKSEDDAVCWEAIELVLGGLETVLSEDEEISGWFRMFAKRIVLGLTKVVSWDKSPDDGHLTSLLRGTMVRLLSVFCYDDEEVASEAQGRFQKFQEDPADVQSLPSDMRSPVFKIVLKNGGQKEYESLLSYFDTAVDQSEKIFVLGSLGHAKDARLKQMTMEWSVSGAVKLQDFFYPMGSVGQSSKEGRDISWQFFQNNFEKIKGMISKSSPSIMNACIVSCCGAFCSAAKADEIDAFFKTHPLPLNARKIEQTTENMRVNGKLLEKLRQSELSKASFWDSI